MAVTEAPNAEGTVAERRAISSTRSGRTTPAPRTIKGAGLARGPALVLGTILLAAGLYFLYRQHGFPRWRNFPDGHAPIGGKAFFGIFGVNGFTGELTAIAGGLLLIGAAQHLLAKTMSLLVGIALAAAAIIAAISGDVLGLAAANGWTEVGWGASALILLLNVLAPRRRKVVAEPAVTDRSDTAATPTAAADPAAADTASADPAASTTGRRRWFRRAR
jgi:hypothetical protein